MSVHAADTLIYVKQIPVHYNNSISSTCIRDTCRYIVHVKKNPNPYNNGFSSACIRDTQICVKKILFKTITVNAKKNPIQYNRTTCIRHADTCKILYYLISRSTSINDKICNGVLQLLHKIITNITINSNIQHACTINLNRSM